MMIKPDSFPFQFTNQACHSCGGRCCRGLGGYVWISQSELHNMATAKGMDPVQFAQQYLRQIHGRLSLRERVINGEHFCCFFDSIACICTIYENRPEQCRQFPFWEKFKEDYKELLRECPGIIIRD